MQDYNKQIAGILSKRFFNEQLNEKENIELETWLKESEKNRQIYNEAMKLDVIFDDIRECYSLEGKEAM